MTESSLLCNDAVDSPVTARDLSERVKRKMVVDFDVQATRLRSRDETSFLEARAKPEEHAFMPQHSSSLEDWGKVLGDTAAVTAMLDRLPHHAHVLKCGPSS